MKALLKVVVVCVVSVAGWGCRGAASVFTVGCDACLVSPMCVGVGGVVGSLFSVVGRGRRRGAPCVAPALLIGGPLVRRKVCEAGRVPLLRAINLRLPVLVRLPLLIDR